jgi:hypothetical protein
VKQPASLRNVQDVPIGTTLETARTAIGYFEDRHVGVCDRHFRESFRSPTYKPEPYSYSGEFDESGGHQGSEMLEFIKSIDEIAEAIEIGAEAGDIHPVGHWFDVAPPWRARRAIRASLS